MITEKSEFFDPATCPYEVHGFYEELYDIERHRPLGDRMVQTIDRPLGSDGRKEIVLTETVTLKKGFKTITVKATPQRPVRCYSMFQLLCGKVK